MVLYSEYCQELIEYIVNCVLPLSFFGNVSIGASSGIKDLNLPKWLVAAVNTTLLLQFFKGESILTEDLQKEAINNLKLDNQWKRMIYINNLPLEHTIE